MPLRKTVVGDRVRTELDCHLELLAGVGVRPCSEGLPTRRLQRIERIQRFPSFDEMVRDQRRLRSLGGQDHGGRRMKLALFGHRQPRPCDLGDDCRD